MKKEDYQSQRGVLMSRAGAAQRALKGDRWIFIFEGRDTAGKTGTIERLMSPMDKACVTQEHMSYPDHPEQKKAQKDFGYYQTMMPKDGCILFFDRSWYTAIIADQVNKPQSKDWEKVFLQCNAFERKQVDAGIKIAKFHMDMDKTEQYARLKQRQNNPKEKDKLSKNDWKGYWQYDQYTKAIEKTLDATGTDCAPWYAVDMNDKWQGRLACMEIVVNLLENSKSIEHADPKIAVPG